jgi:LacI family repressor for deo operon, udp, cdd, tsx, nupC, and nupG
MHVQKRSTSMEVVAKLAGVSTSTVSRALSRPELVSPKTRARISRAVNKVGYRLNLLGRSLRKMESRMVTVIVTTTANSFFTDIIRGVESIAHEAGYCVLLGETGSDSRRKKSYAELVDTRRSDGMIVLTTNPLPRGFMNGLTSGLSVPVVLVCQRHRDPHIPTVRIDDVAAAKAATGYLVALGHRRIGCVAGPRDHAVSRDRLQGYSSALKEARIDADPALITYGDFLIDSGVAATKKLISQSALPTAILAFSDEMAIGSMSFLKAHGLRVPRDVSVVGFDDIRYAAFADPPLTTVAQPKLEIGKAAMEVLLGILENRPGVERNLVLPFKLIIRGSAARPAASGRQRAVGHQWRDLKE